MTTHDSLIAPTDIRATFAKAVALAGDVLAGVRPDQLGLPTPCSEFDVQALVDHLLSLPARVAAIGRGEDAFALALVPWPVTGGDLRGAWREGAYEIEAAWADAAVLTRIVHLPWGDLPGAAALAGYVNEVTVHTWDLATATGQHPSFDSEVVETAYATMTGALPATGRDRAFVPFADPVAVGSDASPIDRLVAFNGRRP